MSRELSLADNDLSGAMPVRRLPFLDKPGRNIRPRVVTTTGSFATEKSSKSPTKEEIRLMRALELLAPEGDRLGGLLLSKRASLEQRRLFAIAAGPGKLQLEFRPPIGRRPFLPNAANSRSR